MKPSLQPGLEATTRLSVTADRTIDFMGDALRVYATPRLLYDIEMACRELLLPHLDAGEDSVGTRVELDHAAASLVGQEVEISVRIAEVNGRAVTFDVSARDNVEPICRCKHSRFIVDVAKTAQRLAAKAQKAGLA
jgi:fluoroacetyl-CoA thioesterase